jgi:hypothetical protein
MATSHTFPFVMDPDLGIGHKEDMDGARLYAGFTSNTFFSIDRDVAHFLFLSMGRFANRSYRIY